MKATKISTLCLASILILGSCNSKKADTSASANDPVKAAVTLATGNYVSDGYDKRSEGYDWVAVMVSPATDSTVSVTVRSRTDIKKPTCTFDAEAVYLNDSTFEATVEGKKIDFTFSPKSVVISAPTKDDENALFYFCSGGGTLAGSYTRIEGEPDQNTIDKRVFTKMLNLQNISFDIQTVKKDNKQELTVTPYGLKADNKAIVSTIDGKVTDAEIEDLNSDGFPEVLVYVQSADKKMTVIGYSVNNGKSISSISFPADSETPENFKYYNGFDKFAVVENTLSRQYPEYVDGQANGIIKQINYKLVDGEASRKFVIKNTTEIKN